MDFGELVVASIYVPADKKRRATWLRFLREYVDEHLDASKRIVLCGDFNVNERVATRDERLQLELLTGFVDLYRCLHPREDGFNFGSDPRGPVTTRLNRVFGTKSVASALQCAWVDLEYRNRIPDLKDGSWTKSAPLIVDIK